MSLRSHNSTLEALRAAGTCTVCHGYGSTPFAYGRGHPVTLPCGACDGTGRTR